MNTQADELTTKPLFKCVELRLCKAAAPLAVKSAEFPAYLPEMYHGRFIGR